jgi:hypothetical protein
LLPYPLLRASARRRDHDAIRLFCLQGNVHPRVAKLEAISSASQRHRVGRCGTKLGVPAKRLASGARFTQRWRFEPIPLKNIPGIGAEKTGRCRPDMGSGASACDFRGWGVAQEGRETRGDGGRDRSKRWAKASSRLVARLLTIFFGSLQNVRAAPNPASDFE